MVLTPLARHKQVQPEAASQEGHIMTTDSRHDAAARQCEGRAARAWPGRGGCYAPLGVLEHPFYRVTRVCTARLYGRTGRLKGP